MEDVCVASYNRLRRRVHLQYDGLIDLYHAKFADPGLKLMGLTKPLLKPIEFSNKIDFVWFELWHHEGRRARHAVSMMGPDYTLARDLSSRGTGIQFIPELEDRDHGLTSKDGAKVEAAKALKKDIDEVLNDANHRWYLGRPTRRRRTREALEGIQGRYQ